MTIVMQCLWRQVKLLFCSQEFTTPTRPFRGKTERIFLFKIHPMQMRKNTSLQYDAAAALVSSWHATKYLDVDLKRYFEVKKNPTRTIYYEQNSKILSPRYNWLHVKMVQYQQNEQFKVHIDGYDLIVLTISGSITIQSSGNTRLALPEHQYAFVPAGVSHGFNATTDGPVRLLFIEINWLYTT